MISVGVSAGVFFSLVKLLPLFDDQLPILAVSGGATFLFSNLIGLKQSNVQRLLGYSSIGQMGLLLLALALLHQVGAVASIPLVVGGLFFNHLLAKAGLFWIAAVIRQRDLDKAVGLAGRPFLAGLLTLFLVAIAGLPPFPGFWAKWELVMQLTGAAELPWVALILCGSLLEAAYMFRWFTRAVCTQESGPTEMPSAAALFPIVAVALLLCISGYVAARASGAGEPWMFVPLLAGAVLYALDRMPGRVKDAADACRRPCRRRSPGASRPRALPGSSRSCSWPAASSSPRRACTGTMTAPATIRCWRSSCCRSRRCFARPRAWSSSSVGRS